MNEFDLTEHAFNFFNDNDLVPTIVKQRILEQYLVKVQQVVEDSRLRLSATRVNGDLHIEVLVDDRLARFVTTFELCQVSDQNGRMIWQCYQAVTEIF